ncbi:MAG TPA: hypothetical protein VLX32_10540 [Candidatus Acidoferrum sp.]|nr:hypothetical protein [Candidatus Acidoferrum sp.]
MTSEEPAKRPASYWGAVLSDVHFWIPAIVLLGGLLVLHWIQ